MLSSATSSATGVTSVVAGTGIGVSAATGDVTISNTGVTSLTAGTNITLTANTGAITIASSSAESSITSNFAVVKSTSGSGSVSCGFTPKFAIGVLRNTGPGYLYMGVWTSNGGSNPNGLPLGNLSVGTGNFCEIDGNNYIRNIGVSGTTLTYDYGNSTAFDASMYFFITG